jgi:hypothetical protein
VGINYLFHFPCNIRSKNFLSDKCVELTPRCTYNCMQVFKNSVSYCPILNRILLTSPNIIFCGNPFGGSRVVTCRQLDGGTAACRCIFVAFRCETAKKES